MNALTRFDRIENFMPEFFRRFAWPPTLTEPPPGDIRIDVTENDKEYEVRAEKREGAAAKSIPIQ